MDFFFLGTGNAFGHDGRRRSHYLWTDDQNLLIDASYDALSGLRSLGMSVADLDQIYISHLHPDHYMALPQFALENYYVIKHDDPIQVFGPENIEKTILDATSLFYNDEVVGHISELYTFFEVGEKATISTPHGKLQTFPADHKGNARMQIITHNGISLGYTGDTAFVPKSFEALLEADFIISEASSGKHHIPHHTTLEELINYPIPMDKQVFVSHVDETVVAMKDEITPPLYLTYDGMKISF